MLQVETIIDTVKYGRMNEIELGDDDDGTRRASARPMHLSAHLLTVLRARPITTVIGSFRSRSNFVRYEQVRDNVGTFTFISSTK